MNEFNQSYGLYITPLVTNGLRRGHAHTHTHMHTNEPHRINFKKPCACRPYNASGLKRKKTIPEPSSSTVVDNVPSVDTSGSDSELQSDCDGDSHEKSTSESAFDLVDQWDTWLH